MHYHLAVDSPLVLVFVFVFLINRSRCNGSIPVGAFELPMFAPTSTTENVVQESLEDEYVDKPVL